MINVNAAAGTQPIYYGAPSLNDTVENNTDNVQIKSDNFKNWFGDWENNSSKASKVINEDGTPKVVYHGTDKGGFYVLDPKMSDDKISLFFSDSKVTSITFYHFLSR